MKTLICFLVVAFTALTAPAQNFIPPTEKLPSGPATIAGQLKPAQTDIALAGIEVILYALQREAAPGVAKATTDAAGRFAFDQLSNASDVTYLVGAQYQGVPFPGERVQFAKDELRREVTIPVTQVRALGSGKPPRVLESTLQFERDAQHWKVTETHQIVNENNFTLFDSTPNVNSDTAIFRALLPDNASNFSMPYGVIPEGVDQDGRQIAFRGPLYPGKQGFSFSYQMPAFEGDTGFLRNFLTRSEKLIVLLPQSGIELVDSALTARGVEQIGPHTLRRFDGDALAANTKLVLNLRAPAARHDAQALQLDEVRLVTSRDGIVLYCNEEYLFFVDGKEPIAGTSDTPLFRAKLPPQASDIHFNEDSSSLGLNLAPDGALTLQGPIGPGEVRLSLSYSLPLTTDAATITRTFEHAIPIFSFYIEDNGILVEAERLHRRRPVASEQSIYQRFEAFQLRAGEAVTIHLAPHARPQPLAKWIAPSAAFAALSFVLVGVLMPLRARATNDDKAAQPVLSTERQQRELIYSTIRDLDEDYQTGKIEEAMYKASREELLAQAETLLAKERYAAAREASVVPPTHCPNCTTPIGVNDRFCAQCGAKLSNAKDAAS